MIAVVALILLSLQCRLYYPSHPPPMERRESQVPPSILWSIAMVESSMDRLAVSHDGLDHGMFQLRCLFHEERARKYGAFDPFDAADSARIAVRILLDAHSRFRDWPRAITSFHRGVAWTRRHGVDTIYIRKVALRSSDVKALP